jgi:hypothetical protein
MEDEDRNVLVTVTNLVLNSGDAKARSFTCNITTKLNGNRPVKFVQWNCREKL